MHNRFNRLSHSGDDKSVPASALPIGDSMRACLPLTILLAAALAGGCTSLPEAHTTRAQAADLNGTDKGRQKDDDDKDNDRKKNGDEKGSKDKDDKD